MGFAENFIRGYTMGTHAKLSKEREVREQQEFEQNTEFRKQQLERQAKLDTLEAGSKKLSTQISLAQLQEGRPGPTRPPGLEEFGSEPGLQMPGPVVGQHPEQSLDLSFLGLPNQSVRPRTAEEVASTGLAQKVAEARAAQGVARAPTAITTPTAAKFLGVGVGDEVSPLELPVLTAAAGERAATGRANIAAAARKEDRENALGDPDYLADQVLGRGIEFRSLTKDQKGAVTNVLSQRGMAIPRALTQTERNLGNNAISALNALDRMDTMLKRDPGLPIKETVPGIGGRLLGASEYRAARNEAVDVLARARTGAAMRPDEEAYYKTQTAQAGDAEDVIARKHMQLRALYLGLSGIPVKVIGPDGTTVVYQDAYDQKQRLGIRKRIEQGWRLDY